MSFHFGIYKRGILQFWIITQEQYSLGATLFGITYPVVEFYFLYTFYSKEERATIAVYINS